jgi:septum formation protein
MVVLASQSPRRREILTQAGIPHVVKVSGIEEEREPGERPERYVVRLACDKARAIGAPPEDYVLAADTTVVMDEHVLEKPASPEDAARMLRLLSGREHEVVTGVCLRHEGSEWSAAEVTRVRFQPMSEGEIAQYVASGETVDKAGAYAIQGRASKFIDRVEGCYFNVVGLPVSLVYRILKEAGYTFEAP